MQRGLNLIVLINGVSQVLLQDLRASVDGKKVPIETMQGLVGFTPGAKEMKISFKAAAMVSGLEFDPFTAIDSANTYEIQIPIGPKTLTTQGEFMTAEIGQSTNASTELSFEFHGTFSAPQ